MQLAFQDTNIELDELHKHFSACEVLDYTPTSFGLIPFSETVTGCNFTEPTIMFGGTKLIKSSLKNKLPKNGVVFYDKFNFDQFYYHPNLENHLLNKNAKFAKWGLIKHIEVAVPTFVKPSSDLKYFPGHICIGSGSIENEITNNCMIDIDLHDDTIVMYNVDIITGIKAEYRVFVVNSNIVDISGYMKNGQVQPHIVDPMTYHYISGYVAAIQQIYQPHDHYVIDIADVDGKLKVIEYNCINCSGMYKIDQSALFESLLVL